MKSSIKIIACIIVLIALSVASFGSKQTAKAGSAVSGNDLIGVWKIRGEKGHVLKY